VYAVVDKSIGSLARFAGIVALGTVVSKILGFLRETSFAAQFGASYATDAYLVAMIIPTLMLMGVGPAVTTTLVPVFADLERRRGRDAAFASVSAIINACFIISSVLMVAGMVFARPVVRLVAPGFSGEAFALTVELTTILFPIAVLTVMAHCVTGVLHAVGRFTAPAMTGMVQNVIIITAIMVFGPRYGIQAVAVGTVLGAFSMLAVQWPALRACGYRHRFTLDWNDRGLRQVGRLIGPIIVGTAASQAGSLVIRALASRLPEGSITYLNYSQRLAALPVGVFGTALITVLYPTLARLFSEDKSEFSRTFRRSIGIVFFALLPMAAGLMILAAPVVRLAFERGVFTAEATSATSVALVYAAIGIPFTGLADLTSKAFYATHDTLTPVFVNVGAVGVNVGLSLALVGSMQHAGLSLAASCQPIASFIILQAILRRRAAASQRQSGPAGSAARAARGQAPGETGPSGDGGYSLAASVAKSAVAGAVMWAAVSAFGPWFAARLPQSGTIAQALRLAASVGVGAAAYFGVAAALRSEELSFAAGAVRSRLDRGRRAH